MTMSQTLSLGAEWGLGTIGVLHHECLWGSDVALNVKYTSLKHCFSMPTTYEKEDLDFCSLLEYL